MGGFATVVLKVIYFLIVFGLIIFLAHFASRIMGKKVQLSSGKYMRIVDILPLGSDRMLAIVKVGEDYLLISSTSKGMGVIKTLENFSEGEVLVQGQATGFPQYLDKYRNTYKSSLDRLKEIKNKFSNRDGMDE